MEQDTLHQDKLRSNHADRELQHWRETVLTTASRGAFFLFLPAWLISIITAYTTHMHWWLVYDVVNMLLLGFAAFGPSGNFRLRTVVLLGTTYVAGTLWLTVTGLPGTGRIYLITLVVLAALLLSQRATLLIWVLSLLTVGTIFNSFLLHLVPLPNILLPRLFSPLTLSMSWMVQAFISGALASAIGLTVKKLQQSLRQSHTARHELQQLNQDLEQRVAERTHELQETTTKLLHELERREQAEQALRENQALLRQLIDNAPAIILVKDHHQRYQLVNRHMATLFHLHPEQLIGKTAHDVDGTGLPCAG